MSNEMKPRITRRGFVGTGAALIGWAALPSVPALAASRGLPPVAKDEIVITMIGTGSVIPNTLRYGNSTLVQAGGLNLLVDAGRGCAVRLTEAGMPMGHLDAFFLTHFHSDHVIGLPDLWMTGYLHPDFGTRQGAFRVNGPTGTSNLCNAMRLAFRDDIRIREADEHIDDTSTQIQANEYPAEGGVVFEQNGVKVTAFEVNHGPLIKPACGYRFDYNGLAVTISGDTKFDENLIKHATGSDVIIHEVAVPSPKLVESDQLVMNHHTSAEDVGTVFQRTNVRLGVFSHLVDLLEYDHNDATMVQQIRQQAARTFKGKMHVPNDLGRIVVTKAAIRTQTFNEAKGTWA
jgi:ribonuclease Z